MICFEAEAGVSLLPSVRATWAPQRPDARAAASVPLETAVDRRGSGLRTRQHAAHVVFQLRPGADNDETLVDFLTDLHHVDGQRSVILIWDGLPSHHGRRVLDWVASQDRLTLERLPGYAPDLNPTEQVWGGIKSRELANLCSGRIYEVASSAASGLDRVSNDTHIFAWLPAARRSSRMTIFQPAIPRALV